MASSQDKKIVVVAAAKTIAVTATVSVTLTAIFFFFCFRCYVSRRCRRREKDKGRGSFRREDVAAARKGPNCKNPREETNGFGLRNDVNGFSLRKLEGGQMMKSSSNNNNNNNLPKFVFNPSYKEFGDEEELEEEEEEEEEEEKRVLAAEEGEKKSGGDNKNKNQIQTSFEFTPTIEEVPKDATNFSFDSSNALQQSHQTTITSATTFTPTLSPPLPKQNPPPPPPPPPLPPPPQVVTPLPSPSPPPVPKSGGWISSRRASVRVANNRNNNVGQMKLKPLHWDKVPADVDHSTVWDEINDGSLRFDDELMETLFGYSTKNRQSSERTNIFSALTKSSSSPPTQIFLLDPRKSQNTAIVLRSLATSRREILDAITAEGQDLGTETLERLTKISLTPEEAAKILRFDGNPSKLADAEAFLFHVLTAVPSAFARLDALLFRASHAGEVSNFRESLRTLESACRELRRRGGVFVKLLEAILKAGNKMNEGTSRGNAQGFNLNTLKKLSDVRSNDGKTTLLGFVVEQVARSEGEKIIRRNNSLDGDDAVALGLPSLEGLSVGELSNVKRAATIEHGSLASLCDGLAAKAAEIRERLSEEERSGWFGREMKGFLEECEGEIAAAREEQRRVMEVVKRTTEYYYQTGDLRDKKSTDSNPFQLFVIVKDFLDVVDQVCVETSRKLRQKRVNAGPLGGGVVSSSPPMSPVAQRWFSNFGQYARFASDKSLTSSESESDDEF